MAGGGPDARVVGRSCACVTEGEGLELVLGARERGAAAGRNEAQRGWVQSGGGSAMGEGNCCAGGVARVVVVEGVRVCVLARVRHTDLVGISETKNTL